MKKISVFGLGYVGLPTAAVFADAGLEVVGVDVNDKAVETINSGRAHIIEPGLDDLLSRVVASGHLRATKTPEKADVFVIAVPTPFMEGHRPDLKYVQSAVEMIAPYLEKGNLVLLESTSPVGATEQVGAWIAEARPDLKVPLLDGYAGDIHLAYCPERVLPGKVIQEVVQNDRVIGGVTAACSELAVAFYKHAVKGDCHITNARTAELCKLTENSFRDVNIAFANELSMIADRLGVDVYELIGLANKHPRVNILKPGTGVGGHCIAVDPWFIVDSAPEQARIIRTAREVNDSKPGWVVDKVREIAQAMGNPKIACMGLAFKPNVDDLRESPSVEAVEMLDDAKVGELLICEPLVDDLPQPLKARGFANVTIDEAVSQADIILFLTAHDRFRTISPAVLDQKTVFDACGLNK